MQSRQLTSQQCLMHAKVVATLNDTKLLSSIHLSHIFLIFTPFLLINFTINITLTHFILTQQNTILLPLILLTYSFTQISKWLC